MSNPSQESPDSGSFLKVLPYLALAACAIPFLQFLIIALGRVTYAFDVEWMEGAILGQPASTVRAGEERVVARRLAQDGGRRSRHG